MKTQFTKEEWSQRKLFDSAILVESEDGEWYHNSISIVDKTGRIICNVDYNTDHDKQGWGTNNNIELWEARAELIVAAPKLFESLFNLVNAVSGDTMENLKIALADAKGIIKIVTQ